MVARNQRSEARVLARPAVEYVADRIGLDLAADLAAPLDEEIAPQKPSEARA